jgi:hypothetical protein
MEEKAIVEAVQAAPRTSIGESLQFEFVNVIFRVLRSAEYQGKVCKATIKEPAWLSNLQPSAPLDGYLVEHGEFSASFGKDDRIKTGLEVAIELNCA